MWFMGYNAISSNLSVYCTKVLNQSAAVAYNGEDFRSFVMGFPFEVILDAEQRHSLMRGILEFLSTKKEKK